MYILFAISALCFLALVLAAVAIASHVRSNRASTHPQHDFAHHLFAAAADQDSRRPRTLTQQSAKDILAKKGYQTPPLQANARNQSTSSNPSSTKGPALCNPQFPPSSASPTAPDRFRTPSPARPSLSSA